MAGGPKLILTLDEPELVSEVEEKGLIVTVSNVTPTPRLVISVSKKARVTISSQGGPVVL
jgi:hypothetical protein